MQKSHKFGSKVQAFKPKLDILQKNDWFNKNFDISKLEFLGKGSFGQVFSIYHLKFKRRVAVKIIEAEPEGFNEIIYELVKMKSLTHPNILGVLEHSIIIHDKLHFLLLVMEQGLMSLDSYLNQNPVGPVGMNEDELCLAIDSLSSAISYTHQQRIVHCDIKPGNVILFQNDSQNNKSGYCLKISDWGSAYEYKEFNNNKATSVKPGMSFTPWFLAPELHILDKAGKGNFFAGDVYALGITFLCCAGIKGKEIIDFSVEQSQEIYEDKLKKLLDLLRKKGISHVTQEKIKSMIKFNSKDRTLSNSQIEVKLILYFNNFRRIMISFTPLKN